MVTRNPEHPSRHKIEVELTESDLKLLEKVQECYAARGAAPSGEEALRMGLRQLADRCRPHGTNNESPKWEMTLTKAQVVEYADAYKELDSNFPDLKGEAADKCISDRLEGAEDFGLDDLLKVAQWKAGKRIDHLIKDKDNSEDKVRCVSRAALGLCGDQQRIDELRKLKGVSWGMASTILHFVFPHRYPIVDIRAMNTLAEPDPSLFNFKRWKQYVELWQRTVQEYGGDPRDIDRALWTYDYCHTAKCPRCVDHIRSA